MSKHRTRATRWNRLLSGVLCLALMLGLLPATGMVQPARAAHWADPYGEQLVEWGVMTPSSDLRLSDTITRAEFTAMCNRTFGYKKLGGTPFVDVPYSEWYAQDIDIAYNAGYFNGTSTNTASPTATLTREEAAVLLARNMMLQETVGESLGFTDSRDLSEWSRGLIGAAAAEGMISGLPDGSFAPTNNITRGEVAAMLVRAIGNPISTAGSRELGSVYGNVMISSSNVTLRNTVILGNLYVTGGVDLGNVLLENVTVLGRIVISGGGESDAARSSVVLRNVAADELVVDSMIDQFVTVSAYGLTDVPLTYVRSNSYLEDSSSAGYGLQHIELAGKSGTKLQIAGNIKEVVNKTPFSLLQLVEGTAETITIDEYARGSQLVVGAGTRIDVVNLDVATLVTGDGVGAGDIIELNIGAADCEVDLLPAHVAVRPGITADVDGEIVNSSSAAELSSEPRLLAGFPTVTNLKPNQAEGLYSGNKPGTIYWAVSELADGSVSVEHLINNPAYGGIIFKDGEQNQSGSIDASARTEYGRPITGLSPDGSYYISAVLVDGRGNRSPLKVFSFTTPDDTVPAFVEGYPYMSLVTCETAQVTAMANKSCQLYWVLLPAGAEAPTAQNFKSGTFGGNYGRGSQSVTKNVPTSIKVNTSRLQEDTDYDLYLWLNDFDGAQSSAVVKLLNAVTQKPADPSFRTPDETPPIVTRIMQTDYGTADAQVSFAINEAPSTLYWAVVTESNESFILPDADLSSLRTQIKVESGASSIVFGSKAANGADVDTYIQPADFKAALDYAKYGTHSFKLYYVAKDAAGNYSEVGVIPIHTLDVDPPHAWLEFSDAVNGNPRANSDIRIVFDEQVKGGAGAEKTFRDYYEAMAAFDIPTIGDSDVLKSLREAMAKELAAHFQLWFAPKTGSPQQVTASSGTGDWINFENAVITMEQGKLVITLPGTDHDGMKQAVNLQSGASYQIRLVGVYDDAFTPNPVAVDTTDGLTCVPTGGKASDNGNGRLYFTTLYAQVELYENTSVSKIDGSGTYKDLRLDLVVDVKPQSTSKVPDTEYWDLIMWSDNVMKVDIYRKVLDKDGKELDSSDPLYALYGNSWEKVNNVEFQFGSAGAGVGLSSIKPASEGQYETVASGLREGYLYRYGIHITSMGTGNISEIDTEKNPDGKGEPTAWSDLVTMRFSLVAGTLSNVQDVSRIVGVNYDKYLENGRVSEIGVVYTNAEPVTILECTKQFVDTMPPAFDTGYPQFRNIGSSAMTVDVSLDRPGRVYWVAVPVSAISVNTGSVTINATNDGREEASGGNITHAPGDFTYIPTDGNDRDTGKYADDILFTAGDNGNYKYYYPTYLHIYNGSDTWRNNPKVKTGYIDIDSSTAIENFTIEGLDSKTQYYICFVLEGYGGGNNEIVEIYRQDTTDPQVPSVIVRNTSTTSARIIVDQDCELSIVLVEYNSLNGTIRGKGATDTKSPLYQMMYRKDAGSNGASIFDVDGDPGDKYTVLQYVTGTSGGSSTSVAGSWKLPGTGPDGKSYPTVNASTILEFDFNEYGWMKSENSEYVVLAVARHSSGGYTVTDYGYGAVNGLYKPDTEPPEFVNKNVDHEQYLVAALTGCSNKASWENGTWREQANNYTYTGSVTITFTKNIYWHNPNNTLYTITYGSTNDTDRLKDIRDLIEGSVNVSFKDTAGNNKTTGNVTNSFTISFTGIAPYQTIAFPSDGMIVNGSDFGNGKKLTLTFIPTLTTADYYNGVVDGAKVIQPGFRVDWS